MKILFALLHYGQLRNFDSVIAELARRGHEIVLAAEEEDATGGRVTAEHLAAAHPGVRLAMVPDLSGDRVVDLGKRLRLSLDYYRFHEPPFDRSEKLRLRLQERLPRLTLTAERRFGRGRAARWLDALERGLPCSGTLTSWLRTEAPDVVLLASLTHDRSAAPEIHRAAARLGILAVACIYSWDHLSSKAKIRRVPERVLLWNDVQAREAANLHDLPHDRITVTGAQCYDHWFGRSASQPRAEFCRVVGLDPDRPFLLYVCSALTPSPDEPGFVVEWISRLRRSADPVVKDLGILIRPHPERLREWDSVDVRRFDNVVMRGGAVLSGESRRDYFDALAQSSAVVGLVTSAFLEAAIAGRPVLTVTMPSFVAHQGDMAHFRYLLEVEAGLPLVARDLDEHLSQLSAALRDDTEWRLRQERFLTAFIRPSGLERPATPAFVDAVEAVPRAPAAAAVSPVTASLPGTLVVAASRFRFVRQALLDAQEWQRVQGLEHKAATKRRLTRERRRERIIGGVRRRLGRIGLTRIRAGGPGE